MIAYRIWRENTIVRELSGGPSLGPNASTVSLLPMNVYTVIDLIDSEPYGYLSRVPLYTRKELALPDETLVITLAL